MSKIKNQPKVFVITSDSTIYFTKCCNFRFIGTNHSPEKDGICRNCGKKWEGEK